MGKSKKEGQVPAPNGIPEHNETNESMTEKYINPYTDFGFKKLFGTEMNKDLLISFLNSLFQGQKKEITDVQYMNVEHFGDGYGDRKAVFDVYCTTSDGSRFIVEMQKAEQHYFKDRSIFYSTYAIREQALQGKSWNYCLEDVYTIGVLNFTFPDGEYPADSYRHEIKLKDVEDNPEDERRQYVESKKDYWDYYSTMQTAEAKGIAKGRAEEKLENARSLKLNGVAVEVIAKSLGLSEIDIEGL